MKNSFMVLLLPAIMLLASCSRGYKAIEYSSDGCAHCKMKIVDARYGAEVVTDKGKVFKFDDILCLKQYIGENKMEEGELMLFVEKYSAEQNDVTDAKQAVYIRHEHFASPMNGNYAAFVSAEEARPFADSLQADILTWNDIQ